MSKKSQINRLKMVDIKLTKKQIEQLKPLFDYVSEQYDAGKPGVILGQPKHFIYKRIPDDYVMTCGFIPQPFANKMIGVAKRAEV
jgi:hypothetical protein